MFDRRIKFKKAGQDSDEVSPMVISLMLGFLAVPRALNKLRCEAVPALQVTNKLLDINHDSRCASTIVTDNRKT